MRTPSTRPTARVPPPWRDAPATVLARRRRRDPGSSPLRGILLLLAISLSAGTGPLFAQAPAAAAGAAEIPEASATVHEPSSTGASDARGLRWQITALGGTRGVGDGGHLFGGIEGAVLPGRIGGAATAQLGRGNGFRSTLIGAGVAAELVSVAGFDLVGWVGPGFYAEGLDSGPDRSLLTGVAAFAARRELGPGTVSLHLGWLAGQLDRDDFSEAIPVRSFRLAVGIGLGGSR